MANKKEYELLFKIGGALTATFKNSMNGAAGAMKGLAASAKALGQTQKDISAFKKTTEQLGSNREKLAALTAEHDRLKAAIDGSTQPSERLLSQLARNEKQIDKVNAAIIKEENELNRLQNSLNAAGVNTSNLDQKNRELAADYEKLAKVQKELNGIQAAQAANNAAISKTGASLAKTVAAGGVAATAVWQMALKPAADFEQQIAAVGAISGASGEDMAALSAKAKELGASTSFSAAQVAKAMEYTSMAGWSTQQTLEGLPGILDLAAASGEDLAGVSDIVTDALTALGMKVSESGHLADIMAAASSNANTNVAMLGESFKYCASTVGAMKYSAEDASIALALMANAGIKGSQSGTTLRTALVNMAKPSKEMATYMDRYGISLKDNAGNMKSLREVMVDLRKNLGGLATDEQAAAAAAIFGKESMAGMLSIINASDADFDKLTKAIDNSNGAAKQMAEKRLQGLNGQLTLLKSAIEGVQIAVGEALLPPLTQIAQEIAPVIQNFATWAGQHPELIKDAIKLGAALIAGKAAFLGIKLAVLEVNKAYLAGKEAMTVYQAAQLMMKTGNAEAAEAISPVGKAVGGLATTMATTGKTIGGGLAKIPGMISQTAGGIAAQIAPLAKTIGGGLAKIPGMMGNAISGIAAQIALLTKTVGGGLAKIPGMMGKAIIGLASTLAPLAASFAAFIAPLLPIIAGVAALAAGFYLLYKNSEVVRQAVDDLKAAFRESGAQIWESLQPAMASLSETGKVLKEAFSGLVTSLVEGGAQIWANLQPALTELAANVFPLLQQAGQFAGDALVGIFMAIGAVAMIVFPLIESIVAGTIGNITIIIQTLTGVFVGIIQFLTGVFTGDLSMALEGIKGIFSSVFEGIKNIVSNTINFISNGISNLISKAKEITGIGGGGGASVPAHATGSKNTEDMFIAGENGPELIVGRPNCTVFTAGETASIFAAMRARAGAAAGGGMSAVSSSPAVAVAPVATPGGDTYNINITSAPTITGNGGTVDNLQDHARELARMVMEEIESIQSWRGRLAYGGV